MKKVLLLAATAIMATSAFANTHSEINITASFVRTPELKAMKNIYWQPAIQCERARDAYLMKFAKPVHYQGKPQTFQLLAPQQQCRPGYNAKPYIHVMVGKKVTRNCPAILANGYYDVTFELKKSKKKAVTLGCS